MFKNKDRKDKGKYQKHILSVRILTVMLSVAIFVFVMSFVLNYAYSNKYYFAYNSVASIWILFIVIFLYFSYIKTSEKIQEKERKYEILFNNIDDMMIIRYIDGDGKIGKVFEANDAAVNFFGYSREEMRDMPPDVFVIPSAKDKVNRNFVNIFDDGSQTFETTFLTKDGRTAPVEVNSNIFMINGIRVMMSWARDLTERVEAQNSIREAERSHKNLIEGMPDGVIIQHFPKEKAIIEFANKSAATILGFRTPEELKGKNFLEGMKSDVYMDAVKRRGELLAGEKIPLIERTIKANDGIERMIEVSTIPYEMGGSDRYISIIRDVTGKKANEKLIAENDHQLRRLLETMPDAVLIYDAEKYLYVNDAASKLLGEESTKDVIDKSIYTYVEPAHFKNMEKRLHELEKGFVEVPMIEQRILRSDKSEVFVETKTIKFPFMGKNSFVSIARDITERLLLQEEKKKNEERYRHLIENFPDAIFVYNNESYLFANISAAKLLGLEDPSVIVGRPIMYFFEEESKKKLWKRLIKLADVGEIPPMIDEEIINEEGKKIPVEIKTIKFPYSNGLAFLSVMRDKTEIRRNEELIMRVERQTEYERMRTEYFANISHDFRTPLHAISGTLQLMEMKNAEILKKLPEFSVKNKRYLQIMKQNNNRLIKLVNNLIDINKIEAGFYRIVKKNRNVTKIICNVVSSVTELARSEGIKMLCQVDSESVVLACDIDKIERIMLNLLSNAIKFTPTGGQIKTAVWEENNRFFVSVEDTGIGIEEDQLDRIFDRFSQTEDVFTRSNEGSGIGLSLVKGFVKMHGGSIGVKSEIGKGSIFTFDIPIEVERNEEGVQLPVEAYDDFIYGTKLEVEFSDVKKRFYETM